MWPHFATHPASRVAHVARTYAEKSTQEFEIILAQCLLSAALIEEPTDKSTKHRYLADADKHLSNALINCRRSTLVMLEPGVLLTLARLRHAQGERAECLKLTAEALETAKHCGYRLDTADICLFLGQIAFSSGLIDDALLHFTEASQQAECDGGRHSYSVIARLSIQYIIQARQNRKR